MLSGATIAIENIQANLEKASNPKTTTRYLRQNGEVKINIKSKDLKIIKEDLNTTKTIVKTLDIIDKTLTIWDIGNGMDALTNKNPSKRNFWPGIPIVGGFFEISDGVLEQNEKDAVNMYLRAGYQTTVAMITNSKAGKNSGLMAVWVTSGCLQECFGTRVFFHEQL
jgi:hypothetical protein